MAFSIHTALADGTGVKKIGEEIRKAREAAGLTQTQLAEAADLHRTYISQLERDIKSPSLDVFLRLCKAMKISAAKLISHIEQSE